MTANEIAEMLSVNPFQPFTIHMSDGKHFKVEHPDQVLITPTKIIVGIGRIGAHTVDHAEHCSLAHITRL